MRPLLGWAGLGSLTVWGVGSQGEHPEREPGGKHIALYDLVLEVPEYHVCLSSQLQRPAQVPNSLDTNNKVLENMWELEILW